MFSQLILISLILKKSTNNLGGFESNLSTDSAVVDLEDTEVRLFLLHLTGVEICARFSQ